MLISCPSCAAQYEVDKQDISVSGQEVQCSDCLTIWVQARDGSIVDARTSDALASGDAVAEQTVEAPETSESAADIEDTNMEATSKSAEQTPSASVDEAVMVTPPPTPAVDAIASIAKEALVEEIVNVIPHGSDDSETAPLEDTVFPEIDDTPAPIETTLSEIEIPELETPTPSLRNDNAEITPLQAPDDSLEAAHSQQDPVPEISAPNLQNFTNNLSEETDLSEIDISSFDASTSLRRDDVDLTPLQAPEAAEVDTNDGTLISDPHTPEEAESDLSEIEISELEETLQTLLRNDDAVTTPLEAPIEDSDDNFEPQVIEAAVQDVLEDTPEAISLGDTNEEVVVSNEDPSFTESNNEIKAKDDTLTPETKIEDDILEQPQPSAPTESISDAPEIEESVVQSLDDLTQQTDVHKQAPSQLEEIITPTQVEVEETIAAEAAPLQSAKIPPLAPISSMETDDDTDDDDIRPWLVAGSDDDLISPSNIAASPIIEPEIEIDPPVTPVELQPETPLEKIEVSVAPEQPQISVPPIVSEPQAEPVLNVAPEKDDLDLSQYFLEDEEPLAPEQPQVSVPPVEPEKDGLDLSQYLLEDEEPAKDEPTNNRNTVDDFISGSLESTIREQSKVEDTLPETPKEDSDLDLMPADLIGQRARVPDLDALKQTVRSKKIDLTAEEKRSGGIDSGFIKGALVSIGAVLFLLILYLLSDTISSAVPALAPVMNVYVALMDIFRTVFGILG